MFAPSRPLLLALALLGGASLTAAQSLGTGPAPGAGPSGGRPVSGAATGALSRPAPPKILGNPSTSGPRGQGSLDPVSPEVPAVVSAGDVGTYDLACGPDLGWTRAELGVPVGGNVDAIADFRDVVPTGGPASSSWPPYGQQTPRDVVMSFSVDRASAGLLRVRGEALTDGAASDTFGLVLTPTPGIAFSITDGDCLSILPGLESDIDGIVRSKITRYPIVYSVDPPTAAAMGVSPADILLVTAPGAPPLVIMPQPALGLVPGDDINALAVGAEGMVFSLARGSPSTLGFPLVGSGGLFAPGPVPWAFAPQCNLLPTDDLNAVAIGDPERQHHGVPVLDGAVMCEDAITGATNATSLWRVFDLTDHEYGYSVNDVEVGVALVELYDFDVTVNLWSAPTPDPLGPKNLLGSSTLTYPAGIPPGTLFHHPFDEIDCGNQFLWIEMLIPPSPNFPFDGRLEWLGATLEEQPTFFSAPVCQPQLIDLDLVAPEPALHCVVTGFEDYPIQLIHGELEVGQQPFVTVIGLQPFEPVHLYLGLDDLGLGPCLPPFGGLCLDILNPLGPLPPIPANPDGIAVLPFPVPPEAAGLELSFQAVVMRGPGGASSVKTNATKGKVP